ncbi:MAG: PorV/PorQ family protein [Candidatus Neomarinimicrobiota bacterium]
MKRLITTLLLGGISLGIMTSGLYAGSKQRVGTSAASQLLIPVGARDLAMGGSTVALSSGIEALYWNPAGIARSGNNADLMVSRMDYFADIGVNYVAVSGNFSGFGSLAFSVKSLSFGDIPITTEDAPDGTGGSFSPTFFTTGLTFARQLTDRVFVGVTLNLISEEFSRVQASGTALTVGVQYSSFVNVPGLTVGVVIKDVGTQMQYGGPGLLRTGSFSDADRGPAFSSIQAASFDLPSTMELGMSYTVPMPGNSLVNLTGMFQNNNYSSDEYRVGGEYVFGDFAFVRGGYTLAADDDEEAYLFGPTFGGGVKLDVTGLDMAVDYGFRASEILAANHVFALKIGF